MNFAYNMMNHLGRLERTLMWQFRKKGQQKPQLEVEVSNYSDGTIVRKFFHEGENKELCRIVDSKKGKIYYDGKSERKQQRKKESSQYNDKEHETASEGFKWTIRTDE